MILVKNHIFPLLLTLLFIFPRNPDAEFPRGFLQLLYLPIIFRTKIRTKDSMAEITPITEWPDYATNPQGGDPFTQDLNAPYDKVEEAGIRDRDLYGN